MNKSHTSIVVVNYNHGSALESCLKSLSKIRPKPEIIIVDDKSSDNSIDVINKFPFQLIKNPDNLGPTKSRNIGSKLASSKNILFLDSDIKISADYIFKLEQFLLNNQNVGIVTGKILHPNDHHINFDFGYEPDLRDYLFGIFDLLGRLIFRNSKSLRGKMDQFSNIYSLAYAPKVTQAVDWVIEQAFMIRKDLFDQLGGFDERFKMYFEGPDLCRRARELNYQVYFLSDAVAKDLGEHTDNPPIVRNMTLFFRHLQYAKKYFQKPNPKIHQKRSAWFY